MADKITVETDIDRLREKLLRWSRVAPNEVRKALAISSELIRREVQQKHFRLPKMPRGVGDYTGNAWLGTKGAWRLRNSINYRVHVEPGRFSAIIGTNVPYGRKHELGLQGMPFRPFLRPSLEKKRPEALRMLDKALMESYGK